MKKKHMNIHILISVAIFAFFAFILLTFETPGLTKSGALTLSLFIATIYCWIAFGGSTGVNLLSLGLLACTGICTPTTVLQNSFGNYITVTVLSSMITCYALEKHGVTSFIANWFITRKIVKGRPYMFFLLFFFSELLLAYFIDITPIVILYLSFAKKLVKDIGYTKNDKFSKAVYLGVLWSACIGFGATPIAHSVPLSVLSTTYNVLNLEVSWIKYMSIGIPLSLISLLLVVFVIKFIIKPDCTQYLSYDITKNIEGKEKLNAKSYISIAIYISFVIFLILPDTLGFFVPIVKAVLKPIGIAIPSLIAAGLLCIISIGGEPILDYHEAVSSISWPTVVFIACIFGYSSVLSMEEGGITKFLNNLVQPISFLSNPFIVIAVSLLCLAVITNFASDIVTATIGCFVTLPLMMILIPQSSIINYTILLSFICSFGIATAAGSAFVALTQKDGVISGTETLKYGMIYMSLIYIVVIITMFLTMYVF